MGYGLGAGCLLFCLGSFLWGWSRHRIEQKEARRQALEDLQHMALVTSGLPLQTKEVMGRKEARN